MTQLYDKYYWTDTILDLPDQADTCCVVLLLDKELPEDKDNILLALKKATVFHLPIPRYGIPSEISYTQIRDSIAPVFDNILFVCDDMQRSMYILQLLGYSQELLDQICDTWSLDFLYSESVSQKQKQGLEILTKDLDFFRYLVKEALELGDFKVKDQIDTFRTGEI